VAARKGIAVSLPSAAGGGGVVDSAALGEFAEQVTGPTVCWLRRPARCWASSAWTTSS
jgi:3-oxoacyl-ACP reductase-like protein